MTTNNNTPGLVEAAEAVVQNVHAVDGTTIGTVQKHLVERLRTTISAAKSPPAPSIGEIAREDARMREAERLANEAIDGMGGAKRPKAAKVYLREVLILPLITEITHASHNARLYAKQAYDLEIERDALKKRVEKLEGALQAIDSGECLEWLRGATLSSDRQFTIAHLPVHSQMQTIASIVLSASGNGNGGTNG